VGVTVSSSQMPTISLEPTRSNSMSSPRRDSFTLTLFRITLSSDANSMRQMRSSPRSLFVFRYSLLTVQTPLSSISRPEGFRPLVR